MRSANVSVKSFGIPRGGTQIRSEPGALYAARDRLDPKLDRKGEGQTAFAACDFETALSVAQDAAETEAVSGESRAPIPIGAPRTLRN